MAEKSGAKKAPGGKKDPQKCEQNQTVSRGIDFFLVFSFILKKETKKYISLEVYLIFHFFSLFWEK